MGGIDDHRNTSGHALLDALMQSLLNVDPRALNCSITKHLSTDGIGGEHLRRWFTRRGEQGRQGLGKSGLAASGLSDQQVAAQRRHREAQITFHSFARTMARFGASQENLIASRCAVY